MEINSCAELLQWYAEEGRRACGRLVPARDSKVINMVRRDPVGPVAAFSPWNFPASQAVRKLAPALAAGFDYLERGEEAPGALIGVVQALVDAGLPDGVLALVFGRPAEISAHLIASPIIRKVSFTGSVPVGKLIATQAAQNVKTLHSRTRRTCSGSGIRGCGYPRLRTKAGTGQVP
jgi:succinate-semialdehyde dehydrogenase/glutarate-semialdehyde dehydrogenase